MPTDISLEGVTPYGALMIKHDLVRDGLVQDLDFSWQYVPPQVIEDPDLPGFTTMSMSRAIFSFRDPSRATFYQLKWVK